MAKTFKEIIAWQKAHQLVLKIYKFTNNFPDNERFGLTSQMRRSATSIPSNIAEGYKRKGNCAINFFNISEGSLEELKYQTLLAYDLNYITKQTYIALIEYEEEVGKILNKWKKTYITN